VKDPGDCDFTLTPIFFNAGKQVVQLVHISARLISGTSVAACFPVFNYQGNRIKQKKLPPVKPGQLFFS
jgi:hypothetical protein